MTADPRVRELLEEVVDTKRGLEDVCCEHPELLADVRLRWQSFSRLMVSTGHAYQNSGGRQRSKGSPWSPGVGPIGTAR